MAYVMFLTLNDSGPEPYIEVVKKNQAIDKNPGASQKLSWHLSQNAYQGEVYSFDWLEPVPPKKIFSLPQRTPAGKRYNMDDDTEVSTSKGPWAYELKVKIGNNIYSTKQQGTTEGASDPTIKNK